MRAGLATLACLVVLAGVTARSSAQDRAAFIERVESARARVDDERVPVAQRLESLERAMAERSALLDALPGDAHRAIWLLDQAADTLVRLSMRQADTRSLVGLPDLDDLAATHEAATHAIDLAAEAGRWIDDRFKRQRAILDGGGELAEGDRALNRQLADAEHAIRRPLLMGRALVLRRQGDDHARAAAILEGLRLRGGPAAATRDIALAVALEADQPERSAGLLQSAAANTEAGGLARAEAMLLLARHSGDPTAAARAIDQAAASPPFIDSQGLADPALLVLAAEARARVQLEAGLVEAAARELLTLEDRRDLGGTAPQRAALADARLAALAERVGDWSGVEPAVVLRAAAALVSRDRRPDDARAARVLADLLAGFDAHEREAARDGKPWAKPPERDHAMERLARLRLVMADHEPDAKAATTMREGALVLVARLIEGGAAPLAGLLPQAASHALGPAGLGLSAQAREALLRAALEHGPGHEQAHRWRLGLASILATQEGQLAEVLALARQAMQSPEPTVRDDATTLAAAAHAQRLTDADDQTEPGRQALAEALDFARQHPGRVEYDARALALRLAGRWVELVRRPQAEQAIEALIGLEGPDALVLRARALDILGRAEEAFAAFRAVSEAITYEADGQTYWLVWTRLLELLNAERLRRVRDGGPAAGESLEVGIRGHLLRLRALDAQWGGPPWAGRLDAVEASVGR